MLAEGKDEEDTAHAIYSGRKQNLFIIISPARPTSPTKDE